MAAVSPTLKLTYFDIEGLAEPARLAFVVGGIPFEDKRIAFSEWGELKQSGFCPLGQLPVLEIDGKKCVQSGAMLGYAGRLSGLYPGADAIACMKIDEISFTVDDIRKKIAPTMYMPDGEEKMQKRKELAETILPDWFGKLEALLQYNNEGPEGKTTAFSQGGKLSIADLHISTLVRWLETGMLDGVPKDIAAKYASVQAICASVDAVPAIKEWRAAHKK